MTKTGDNFFTEVRNPISFPEIEEEVLSYWKKNKIFERSVDERSVGKSWTFLDGPPFITGLPSKPLLKTEGSA